ncbi:hypothetical protein N657DRAFT_679385 [Parathielavia appendiculata]|uniref:DUF1996 domain-containing protein n=1 Tax=Parathielavia appendiculata TaxID=2587402 RepID=A0AAN6U4S0_9PEZI|nr:hypothetical protein N657DRAFT_679385 [Parathielavia appendiculata]
MSCSQLVVDRIDPLVNPGVSGSPHLHQLVGGDSLSATMDPGDDRAELSTCTTCTLVDDFSNYWTAVMYFRAGNGTYKRVKQVGAIGHEMARGGGITVYYVPPHKDPTNIVAFKKGFRMRNGDPNARNATSASRYQGIDYTCLIRDDTRYTNRSATFPDHMCPQGILTTIYFPPCWDGVDLDSPDHYSHVSWPANNGAPCPASRPVKIPQIILEIRWDTREFNKAELWPQDGSQPFVWSFGDTVGYGHHGDYVFGWRGDSLAKAFSDDPGCLGEGNTLCTPGPQTIRQANECILEPSVREDVDGWLEKMPVGVEADP